MNLPDVMKSKPGHEQVLLNKNTNRFFPSMLPEVHDIAKKSKRLVGHSS